jgi:CubicO group peptidase (beta-lactamase class C family)
MELSEQTHPSPERRRLLAAGLALAALGGQARARPRPQADLSLAGLGDRLDQGVAGGELVNLHAIVVLHRGRRVLERYYAGEDELWGRPLGRRSFDADALHDLRSVSKSIVGLLYGLALADGLVPALDTPVLQAFPAYRELAEDPRRLDIHLSHVLGMTMGLEWDEDIPYSDPRNSERAMEASSDRLRYVLERPIVEQPGRRWCYSGGATTLLGHLIARGAGMPLLDYARRRLLEPMGMEQVEWTPGTNGEAAAASGLRMRARDLARVGQLLLQRGQWQGRTLVPRPWLDQCLQARVDAWPGLRYGYHWYAGRNRDGQDFHMAIGLGGQRLVAMPGQDLAYAIFMGNYDSPQQVARVSAVQALIAQAMRGGA